MARKRQGSNLRASSSGSAGHSPASSNGGSAGKERVGKYDLAGLCKTWDNDEKVRQRVRDGHYLVQNWDDVHGVAVDSDVDKTVSSCKHNAFS